MSVLTGLDLLAASEFKILHGQRIGLLVHPASIDRHLCSTVELFAAAKNVNLCALFGPQHGLLGQTQDNMIEWEGYTDSALALPVYSLYGLHRKPTTEMLAGIDTLVIDLQDVGARYYTFIWTMLLCMLACAESGVKVLVLDRPNPIGGNQVEGTVLDLEFNSFVGLAPIPMRHALTIGELACYFKKSKKIDVDLNVVWMLGWSRSMYFDDTGLPWVLPSPNMPTLDTAVVYPGGCLLEGTTLSEGRGTTRPFEIFGAPYINSSALVAELQQLGLPGCIFRPLSFKPTFHKYANQTCGGVQVHVIDRQIFNSVLTYTAAIATISRLWPADFGWKEPPYEYETVKLPIDILTGGISWRESVDSGAAPKVMQATWNADLIGFQTGIVEFLHYE